MHLRQRATSRPMLLDGAWLSQEASDRELADADRTFLPSLRSTMLALPKLPLTIVTSIVL